MKKLLTILTALGLVATSSLTVVACGDNENPVNQSFDEVLKEYKEEITDIVYNHISKTNKNFFIVDNDNNRKMKFFTKEKFENYMGEEILNTANDSIRDDLIEDFNNIFKVNELKQEINDLQKLEKYSIILNNIGSVFKEVTLSSNDKISLESRKPTTSKGVWFGITKFDISISVNFRNKNNQLEEFKISDIARTVSLTDNEKVGGDIQEFYNEIGQTFIKSEISKINSEDLKLSNKTYLENIDNEILSFLNGNTFKRSFIQLAKDEFKLNFEISENNSLKNLKTSISYREDAIALNHQNEKDKLVEYSNLFFRKSNSLSKIIDETQEVSNKQINEKIVKKLNNLEAKLGESDEMQNFINTALKYLDVTLTNLHYEVETNNLIEIPDLTLNLGLFKNTQEKNRKNMDEDIIKNLNVAKTEFSKTFGTKMDDDYLIKKYPMAIASFKNESQVYSRWFDSKYSPALNPDLGIEDNINQYTNLNTNGLIDFRNQFISNSKQNNFVFNVSWEYDDSSNSRYPFQSYPLRSVLPVLPNNKKVEIMSAEVRSKAQERPSEVRFNLIFELDYLKFNFKYSSKNSTSWYQGEDTILFTRDFIN